MPEWDGLVSDISIINMSFSDSIPVSPYDQVVPVVLIPLGIQTTKGYLFLLSCLPLCHNSHALGIAPVSI